MKNAYSAIFILSLQHTKFVKGYIGFAILSIHPSICKITFTLKFNV